MSRMISILKKIPIDLGQAERKYNSAGKLIGFSKVPDGNGKKALDVGCRDGYWSERLKEKGYKVSALDLEPFYPGALRHNVEHGLPYKDSSYDLVWCSEVIEHLRRPAFFLREIERVLKSKGKAILTTPNSDWWLYWVTKLWGWTPKKLQQEGHKQFFTEKSIRALAPNYQLSGYFPYALLYWPIKRLIGPLSPTFILERKVNLFSILILFEESFISAVSFLF